MCVREYIYLCIGSIFAGVGRATIGGESPLEVFSSLLTVTTAQQSDAGHGQAGGLEGGSGGGGDGDLEMVTEGNFQEKAACRYTYTYVFMYLCMCVSVCVCVCVCVNTYSGKGRLSVFIYTYVCVCVCVCLCVYIQKKAAFWLDAVCRNTFFFSVTFWSKCARTLTSQNFLFFFFCMTGWMPFSIVSVECGVK